MHLDAGVPTDAFPSVDDRSWIMARRAGVRRTAAVERWRGILPTWYAIQMPRWERQTIALMMVRSGFDKIDIGRVLETSVAAVTELLQGRAANPVDLYKEHLASGIYKPTEGDRA